MRGNAAVRGTSKGLKRWERYGRRLLLGTLAVVCRVRPRGVILSRRPRILLLRVDSRLGNMILLTPVLATLRRRYPEAQLDVLGHPQSAEILASHPALNRFIPYRKSALWHAEGPLATVWRLRRRAYDVCIDLSNPTDPSVTQMMLARLSGARTTVGADHPGFRRLLHQSVNVSDAGAHEVDKRLALLRPLPGQTWVRALTLGPLPLNVTSGIPAFTCQHLEAPYAVVNLGARLLCKRLCAADYAVIGQALAAAGLRPLLTWGPQEFALARQVAELTPSAQLAPPTDVPELAYFMTRSVCVVSCDTGPMHLAVALGRPTFGLFLSSSMARFGYDRPPHACVAVNDHQNQTWMVHLQRFVHHVVASAAKNKQRSVLNTRSGV